MSEDSFLKAIERGFEVLNERFRTEIKAICLEALEEFEGRDENERDLISTRQAYKIRPRPRVEALIKGGFLKRIPNGSKPNSTMYISKKKLLDLDKLKP